MNDEKWGEIIDLIKDKFGILEQEKKTLDPGPGTVDLIVFNGPLGKMKVERIIRPVVIDKKVYSSRRIGSNATEEFIYSDSETTQKVKAFHWDENQNDWVEIEAGETLKF